MPNYIKVKTGSSSWSTATKAYIKKNTGWVQPIRIWMKLLSGWTRVWPISGPFALTSPFIASTEAGSTHLMPTSPIRVGTIYYGRNGTWDANGWTISSYSYQWRRYNLQSAADDTGQTNRSSGTFASPSAPYTPTSSDNKKYLSFYIKPNTTDTFEMSEAESGDDDGRLFAITQIPLGTPGSLTAAPKVGTVITLSSSWASWDTSDARQIETPRTKVAWYKNTTASFTGATLIKNNLSSVAGAYSYTPELINTYIIVRETAFNSGSDYADGVLTLANTAGSGTEVGVTIQAISGLVTAAIAAPTISSITASSIGGPVSVSFTGGSGPFYQIYWWGTATAPTAAVTPDATGSASPLTDNTGPSSTATQYMYVRSVTTQSDTGVANATTISPWSDGVSFNMTSASALTPTFGTNTSTANGFTGSVTNYDSAYNWNTPSNLSFTLTNGTWTWAIASGATRSFTVTGLSASQSSTATVTTTRPDYASGSASTTGTASALPKYTVTWGANGGTGGGSTGPFDAGTSHTAPSPGTRDGFDFTNYRYPASGGTDPVFVLSGGSYTPTLDTTFGAQWTAKTYAVTFDANGGTGAPAGQTKIHGTTLTLSSTAPTRATVGSTQYTFAGWNTADSGTGTSYSAGASYTLNAALSLFAQWTVTTLNWSISWYANGGTGGGTTTQPRGNSHTAPSPGTRSGFTFSQWRKPEFGGDPTFVANNGTFTPTAADSFWAQWTANPVTPTIAMEANSGISATGGTIYWTSTNQSSFSSTGTFNATGTTGTSISKTGLTASTNYTGTVTVTSSTGHTASANYSLTTSGAPFVAPTCGPPQISNNQLGFVRSGTSVTWYSDYPTPQGNYSYIIGMEWQIRTTNSTTTTPLNTGTYAGGGSGDGLQGNTTKYMTYPVSTTYPYSAAGTVWAFRIKSTENTAATSSSRFARARVIMMGTNGTVYFGTWSTNI